MKKLYTLIGTLALFFVVSATQAQVLELQDFEDATAQSLIDFPGWTTGAPGFVLGTTNPCQGVQGINAQVWTGSTSPFVQYLTPTNGQLGTALDIEISFEYDILDEVTDVPATADFGQLTLFYTTDGGTTWTPYGTIGIADYTQACTTSTALITGVPTGATFGWKMESSFNLNYPDVNGVRVFVDNFQAVEQVSCIQPTNTGVVASSVDFDSAEITWDDINTPQAGQYEIKYCISPGDPNGNPFCDPGGIGDPGLFTNKSPYTLSGLTDGTQYFVYVRAVCSPSGNSAWSGPITFQTTAIGSTCNPPIELNLDPNSPDVSVDLPVDVISQTDIYGADPELDGAAGGNCGGGIINPLDGYEVVYHYVSEIDDILTIDVKGLTTNNVGVFVYDSCADIGNLCLDGDVTTNGSDLNINSLQVGPGQDIYIVIGSVDATAAPINTDYTLHIEGFECTTFSSPVNIANSAPNILFATGQNLGYYSGTYIVPTISFASLKWYYDAAATQPVPLPLTNETLMDGAVYYATQTVAYAGQNCESTTPLKVIFDEFNCQTDLTGIASTQGDAVCDSGVMTLSATGSTPNIPTPNLYWYENATGGEPVGVGPSFTTPDLSQTTSYWVTEAFVGEGLIEHQGNPGPSSTATSSSNEGLEFKAETDFSIVDVKVYVTNGATTIGLQLEEGGNVVEGPLILPINPGTTNSPTANTLTLNWKVQAGSTYELVKTATQGAGDPEMLIDDSASFPYPLGTVGEVTGSSSSGSDYYYFFDWSITGPDVLCEETPRTEVIATVHPIIPTSVSADDLLVCVGSSTILHATSSDTDYVYTWDWTDIAGNQQTDTGANITVSPQQNTTYTVTAVNPITTCSFTNEISVDVFGVANLPVDPLQIDLCLGETTKLTAGGLAYDLETTPTGWTKVSASSAPNGSLASAGWKLAASPYIPTGGQLEIISNDASQFYVSEGQLLGPGGTIDEQLISPPLDLVGLNSAVISFYHYYKDRSNTNETTVAKVDISVNNGSWEELKKYGTDSQTDAAVDVGANDSFALETIDISQYVGSANVRVRFHFEGGWGWYWAMDNFTLERGYINGSISWSPGTDLYFDKQATQPYTGAPASAVYVKGAAAGTTTYTATLDITNCGTVTQDVIVTVFDTQTPTAPDPQVFNSGETIADLEVTGQNLTWYAKDANGNYTVISVNTPLVNGETYYVSQTLNGCESGLLPITVNFTCSAPTDLKMGTIGENPNGTTADAVALWTEPANASSIQEYYIKVFMKPGSNETLFFEGPVPVGQPFAIIEDLPLDTKFRLELYAICDSGTTPVNSTVLTVKFNTINLATSSANFEKLTYYPNPTRGKVFFENNLTIDRVEVYSMTGQSIIKREVSATRVPIDFSRLATGTYLVKLTVNGAVQVIQVIKE